uniref:SWI/SNF-related matrix-associated actin-dependent regulator of chromatin subfamily A-like protein 1 n=1 Tax=Auxenochlorella protothecoides TaxID=3075 RepID=A0A1D2AGI9_AUXPR
MSWDDDEALFAAFEADFESGRSRTPGAHAAPAAARLPRPEHGPASGHPAATPSSPPAPAQHAACHSAPPAPSIASSAAENRPAYGLGTLRSLFMQPQAAAPSPAPQPSAVGPFQTATPQLAAAPPMMAQAQLSMAPPMWNNHSGPSVSGSGPHPPGVPVHPSGPRALPASFGAAVSGPSAAPPPSPTLRVSSSTAAPLPAQEPGLGSGGAGPLMHASMELGAERTLELRVGFHDAIAAVLKRLPGSSYSSSRRTWTFPVSSHDEVTAALEAVPGVRVRLEPLPKPALAVLQDVSGWADDSPRYASIPSNLEAQLMPFQREGVRFALARGGRALIGDEMGLGKTVQALAVAAAYRDAWPALIIAPSSLREQWADALHRWLGVTEDRVHVVHTHKDAAAIPARLQFLIASYNFVPKMDLGQRFNLIIADEAHYLKDPKAQRSLAVLPLLRETPRVLLLTGTPALNKPKELFSLLSALVPGARLKMKDFGERYCAGTRWDRYGGASNLPELHALLRAVMVRRQKACVLPQLPRKRRQQCFLSLDAAARRALAAQQAKLEALREVAAAATARAAAAGGGLSALARSGPEGAGLMELYRLSAEVKGPAVQEYVGTLLDGGTKFLAFAHHTCMLDAIEHECNRRKGLRFIRIDGSTQTSDRQRLVNSFQENADVQVAILSIKAAGVGLTLTAASTVVFAEMTWTPGDLIQAEDRAHRIGQASSVNIHFLHAKGSVDDIIWSTIQSKLESVGEALDGQGQALEVAGGARTLPERGQMTVTSFMEGGVRNAAQAGAQQPGHQVPAWQAPAPLPPHQALNKKNAAPIAAAGHLKRSFGEVDLT